MSSLYKFFSFAAWVPYSPSGAAKEDNVDTGGCLGAGEFPVSSQERVFSCVTSRTDRHTYGQPHSCMILIYMLQPVYKLSLCINQFINWLKYLLVYKLVYK